MTDLVTRLRALADTLNGALPMEPRQLAQAIIREAADALEQAQAFARKQVEAWGAVSQTFRDHIETAEQERDALKAKLADAKEGHEACWNELLETRAKLAEAEKQKEVFLDNIQRQVYLTDEARAEAAAIRDLATNLLQYIKRLQGGDWSHSEKALSQPGPGAALLDKLKRYEDALRWYAYEAWTSRDDMGMWVHKLDRDGGDRARAALEEKP